MIHDGYRRVAIVLRSAMGVDEWDLSLPLDVTVRAVIRKFINTAELGFRGAR
jgi:hypothetical protein